MVTIKVNPLLIKSPATGADVLRQWRSVAYRQRLNVVGGQNWTDDFKRDFLCRALPAEERDREYGIEYYLDYRGLQSLASKYDVVIVQEQDEQQSGGGGREKRRSTARRARKKDAVPTGRQRLILYASAWPKPDQALVERARAAFARMAEVSAEIAGRLYDQERWNYARLAVQAELGNPFPAMKWTSRIVPNVLFMLDTSGSMNAMSGEVLALAAAVGEAAPHVTIVAAPNGNPDWFSTYLGVCAIKDGTVWTPKALAVSEIEARRAEARLTEWAEIVEEAGDVTAAVYVGDWEYDSLPQFDKIGLPVGIVSNYRSRDIGRPVFADRPYGKHVRWPCVVGCDSAEDFIAGIEMLLAKWERR